MIIIVFEIFNSLVFLELIELKFCGLNTYIKKNIDRRSIKDVKECFEDKEESIDIDSNYIIDYNNEEEEENEDIFDKIELTKNNKF